MLSKFVFSLYQKNVISFGLIFYVIFVLISNIFVLCQINTKILVDYFRHVKRVKFNEKFFNVKKLIGSATNFL